jgi:hypothetical protein
MAIEITKDSGEIRILGELGFAVHLVVDAVRDISDKIVEEAAVQAPVKTGALKLHPVDVQHFRHGFGQEGEFLRPGESIETRAVQFGGTFSVRGAGGRFVRGTPFTTQAFSDTPEEIILSVPDHPEYAKWVHNGTGIYGPSHEPIRPHAPNKFLHFEVDGKSVFARSVKGQKPNPYLDRAFVIINRTYIPARIERLRLEIRAL